MQMGTIGLDGEEGSRQLIIDMPYINFNTQTKVQIWDRISSRMAHSAQSTFAQVTLEPGAQAARHQHPHEQWTYILEGEMIFELDGEERILTSGMGVLIPSNTFHSAKTITGCKVIDLFMPVREDFVELEKKSGK
jgi:quercetin dioxygenase-like cupin family protein